MQMIELYAYQVGPVKSELFQAHNRAIDNSVTAWDAAKADYNASPVRGKSFCTLPRHEQVEIVRKYVNREV